MQLSLHAAEGLLSLSLMARRPLDAQDVIQYGASYFFSICVTEETGGGGTLSPQIQQVARLKSHSLCQEGLQPTYRTSPFMGSGFQSQLYQVDFEEM